VAGEYVKMTSIGGREVECKNMKRPITKYRFLPESKSSNKV